MKIVITNMTKSLKGRVVLDKINLTMESGTIYGLKGKNGSGKTMLMRAVAGLIYPTKGTVEIDGKVLGRDISFPDSIGLLIENPAFLPEYTGAVNLELLAKIKNKINKDDINKALADVGLDPNDKRTYSKYSLGMKQRLGIAAAIMENPELIILDEPINALDESGAQLVRELIIRHKERGALIIVACHDKDELEFLSDEIIEISEGSVVNSSIPLSN